MKYLLVLVVVVFGVLLWRSGRQPRKPAPDRPAGDTGQRAIEMVQCRECGVHCPRTDALAGRLGLYCTAKHRSQAEP